MDRISDVERQRIAVLLAEGAPVWRLHREINRSRYAIRRAVIALQRPARRERKRSPLRLSLAEREEISRGLAADRPFAWRTVPSRPSWPSARGCARSSRASWSCAGRAGQIAGRLTASYPADPEMRVPHETIYLSLFAQSRGALRKELARYLRSGRTRRRPRGLSVNNGQGQLRGTVHLSQRPAEAGDRAVPGHWEGDLVSGTRSSTVATLAERQSRFVLLVRLPGSHTADVVAAALAGAITTLPGQLRRSLTWDQGKEMAEHARFSVATGVPVCFCDPHRPWQRAATRTPTGGCASTSPQHRLPGAHAK